MANNYSPATISPNLTLTTEQKEILNYVYGVSTQRDQDKFYCYIEEGEQYNDPEDNPELPETLAEYLQTQKATVSPEQPIVIEGAFYCDKMRRGEFGGYCAVITDISVKYASTTQLITDILNGDY